VLLASAVFADGNLNRLSAKYENDPIAGSASDRDEEQMLQPTMILIGGDISPKWSSVEHQPAADGHFAVTRCNGTPEEALATCRYLAPCLLVVNDAFIDKLKVEEFYKAVDFGRSIRVLVETDDDNSRKTERLIRLGCAGVLSRNASPSTACHALQAILAGELWVDRKTVSRIVQNMLIGMKCQLTFRETEILGLLAEGLKNCQIAERLFISPKTVRWHLRSLYSKLGTHDRFYAASQASFQCEQTSHRRSSQQRAYSVAAQHC
jgi:DNA-binding NarL/FixJ family response regulator